MPRAQARFVSKQEVHAPPARFLGVSRGSLSLMRRHISNMMSYFKSDTSP